MTHKAKADGEADNQWELLLYGIGFSQFMFSPLYSKLLKFLKTDMHHQQN